MKYYKNSSDFVPKGYKFYGVVNGYWIWTKIYHLHCYKIRAELSPVYGYYNVVKRVYRLLK